MKYEYARIMECNQEVFGSIETAMNQMLNAA